MTQWSDILTTVITILSTGAGLELVRLLIKSISERGDTRRVKDEKQRLEDREDQRNFYEQLRQDYQHYREQARDCEESRVVLQAQLAQVQMELHLLREQLLIQERIESKNKKV